jgi:parvulin-like peptidyl-prolyl isomerase
MTTRIRPWQGLVVLAFFAGQVSAQGLPAPTRPAAVVNGEPISLAEVKTILDAMPPPVVPATVDQKRELQQNVVDMLIDDLLMRQFLRKNTSPPAPAAIDKEIADLRVSLTNKKSTLEAFLKESNQTEAQLRVDLAASLQWKAYVTSRVSDETLKSYYQVNKLFFDKVMVRASHILIKVAPSASEADKHAARTKLQAIRQEIAAGKLEFAEAAKRFSDCPSKREGGDLGSHFRYKFDTLEPFAQAAFSTKVGEMSDVVQTEHGMHLIKVTDRTAGEPSDFEAIKAQVREIYGMELYQQVVSEQRKTAQVQVNMP